MISLKKYYKIWLPVLSVFLFIALAELVCRGFNLNEKMDADFKFYIHNVDNDLELEFIQEDPLLMWRPKSNYPEFNSEGFRDKEYKIEKDKNVFRILSLGDSSTLGLGIADPSNLYHSLLEDKLNKDFKYQDIRYEVINGGVTGYTSYQGLNLYRLMGAKYHPDIVTFYFGLNDPVQRFYLSDKDILKRNVELSNIAEVYRFLSKLSSYRLLRKVIWLILNDNNHSLMNVPRVSKEEFRANILELNNLCKNNNALLILISPPFSKEKSSEWEIEADIMEYRKLLENVARENNIPLIDVKELTEQSKYNADKYFIDNVHPNEAGHRIIMNNLYSYLVANKLLPVSKRKGLAN
jgi:lysophospholipase L1-like esterase